MIIEDRIPIILRFIAGEDIREGDVVALDGSTGKIVKVESTEKKNVEKQHIEPLPEWEVFKTFNSDTRDFLLRYIVARLIEVHNLEVEDEKSR